MTFEEAQQMFPGMYGDGDRGQFDEAQSRGMAEAARYNAADDAQVAARATAFAASPAAAAIQKAGMGNFYDQGGTGYGSGLQRAQQAAASAAPIAQIGGNMGNPGMSGGITLAPGTTMPGFESGSVGTMPTAPLFQPGGNMGPYAPTTMDRRGAIDSPVFQPGGNMGTYVPPNMGRPDAGFQSQPTGMPEVSPWGQPLPDQSNLTYFTGNTQPIYANNPGPQPSPWGMPAGGGAQMQPFAQPFARRAPTKPVAPWMGQQQRMMGQQQRPMNSGRIFS